MTRIPLHLRKHFRRSRFVRILHACEKRFTHNVKTQVQLPLASAKSRLRLVFLVKDNHKDSRAPPKRDNPPHHTGSTTERKPSGDVSRTHQGGTARTPVAPQATARKTNKHPSQDDDDDDSSSDDGNVPAKPQPKPPKHRPDPRATSSTRPAPSVRKADTPVAPRPSRTNAAAGTSSSEEDDHAPQRSATSVTTRNVSASHRASSGSLRNAGETRIPDRSRHNPSSSSEDAAQQGQRQPSGTMKPPLKHKHHAVVSENAYPESQVKKSQSTPANHRASLHSEKSPIRRDSHGNPDDNPQGPPMEVDDNDSSQPYEALAIDDTYNDEEPHPTHAQIPSASSRHPSTSSATRRQTSDVQMTHVDDSDSSDIPPPPPQRPTPPSRSLSSKKTTNRPLTKPNTSPPRASGSSLRPSTSQQPGVRADSSDVEEGTWAHPLHPSSRERSLAMGVTAHDEEQEAVFEISAHSGHIGRPLPPARKPTRGKKVFGSK
ncbi:hypothetical protein ONZ45_g18369 [Pleurotus djamor]|nr:hypothetical protein ONZ45_g18369 [Pleurotus djamor]